MKSLSDSCKHNISGTSGHLDVLSGLYMATFVLCISICILLFLLLRDVQDVTEFHLPPVEEMQQMGLGQDTIRVLFKAEKGADMESATNSAVQRQQVEQ
uniref:Uncharacterized protein n=1 Tax=Romanomermis culicivorax TaxID=13658 RepID=A0A915I9R7_ROMCU